MNILITTGIYPPKIGGPAQYAKNLAETFKKEGNGVSVKSYSVESNLPTGIRHFFFFFKIIPAIFSTDVVIALDTFSVGLPTVLAGKLFGKKVLVRVGGDFLWESYIERTKEDVLLKDFYSTQRKFTFKEKIIHLFTRAVLAHSYALVFNTKWQKEIWAKAYKLDSAKTFVVENYYGEKEESRDPDRKNFLFATRPLYLKNGSRLHRAFKEAQESDSTLVLDTKTRPYNELIEAIRTSYAVIVPSLTDIAPNLVLDAIRLNKPFILTEETGLREELKEIGVFVDPLDERDIQEKIIFLANPENYNEMVQRVKSFKKVHSWTDIAKEFLSVAKL